MGVIAVRVTSHEPSNVHTYTRGIRGYTHIYIYVGEDEHPRARRKSRGPGGEVNPYFTPPPPGGFISASHHHYHHHHHRCHQHRHNAFSLVSFSPSPYIHPLKDHAQGWGLKSTRSKGCLRPDTLVTEPFFLSLFLSPPPPFFVLSLPPLPWGAIMTRSVVISGGRARLEKEGMERNLWNFMRPILPDQVWKCAFGDVGNVPASNWDHRVSPDADGYIPGDV